MSQIPKELQMALLGVSGRMGKALVAAIDERSGVVLAGASVSPGSSWLGKDVGEALGGAARGVPACAEPALCVRNADVAVDFTLPAATTRNVQACLEYQCPIVIGTTGIDADGAAAIKRAATKIPVLVAPNMSVGVNLLLRLTQLAARALDDDYDVEIFEAHHRNKKDAPSGTALALGRAVAEGRHVQLEDVATYTRHGETGVRERGAIGFSVLRGGDIIGEHVVTLAGSGERVELTHRAHDRMSFARGAIRAARWLVAQPPGLYSMQDVLGLSG